MHFSELPEMSMIARTADRGIIIQALGQILGRRHPEFHHYEVIEGAPSSARTILTHPTRGSVAFPQPRTPRMMAGDLLFLAESEARYPPHPGGPSEFIKGWSVWDATVNKGEKVAFVQAEWIKPAAQ